MRFRRRVVLPEPRKPVTIVTGIGAMLTDCWWWIGLELFEGKMVVVKILVEMERRGEGAIPVWRCPNIACLVVGFWDRCKAPWVLLIVEIYNGYSHPLLLLFNTLALYVLFFCLFVGIA